MQRNNKHLQYILKMCALENCLNLKRIKGEYDLSMSELMLNPHNIIIKCTNNIMTVILFQVKSGL